MSGHSRRNTGVGQEMIPDEIKPAVIDFVSRASEIPYLEQIILFGSAVTGEFHTKSDIDVLVVMDVENPEFSEGATMAHRIASDIAKKHKLGHSFSMVFVQPSFTDIDTDFLWQVAREGIIIWGKPSVAAQETLEPWILISYTLKDMSPKHKMAVHRALYGYKVEKKVGDKVYLNEREGMVNKIGEKLGEAVVMVPARKADQILAALDEYGTTYSLKKIWM